MLSDKTLCMIGQSTGKNGEVYNQYDVHNLYGWSQAEVTYRSVKAAIFLLIFLIQQLKLLVELPKKFAAKGHSSFPAQPTPVVNSTSVTG